MNKYTKWLLVSAVALAALWLLLPITPDPMSTSLPGSQTDNSTDARSSDLSGESLTLAQPSSTITSTSLAPASPAPASATNNSGASSSTVADNAISQRAGQSVAPGPADSAAETGTPRLRPRVFEVIEEIQKRQLAGHWEEALNELNALYTEIEDLNTFEQTTLLNFYTNTLLRLEMYDESIVAFEQILQVPDINTAAESRARRALGDLYARQGDYAASVQYLTDWLATFGSEAQAAPSAQTALLQLANSHNALGQYHQGIVALESHIGMRLNNNQEIAPESYELLQTMYIAAGRNGGVQSAN